MAPPLNSYERIRRLAVGGMGEIFLARRKEATGPAGLAILKMLLPQRTSENAAAQMFAEEARLLTLLRHPNIVRIYEVFEEQGEPVIAMEYVDGESLSVLLRAAATASKHKPAAFIEAVAQAARGLHAAHRAVDGNGRSLDLVHRDVSPQNIMVGRDGIVKLLDFGIAKAVGIPARTQQGVLKGKLAYMAPEQLAGLPLDARADVFALGVVLWECALGRHAYAGKNEIDLLNAVMANQLPRPSEVSPDVPRELEDIIVKAVAPQRELRYQNGAALAEALETYLAKLPSAQRVELGDYVNSLVGPDLDRRRAGLGAVEPLRGAPRPQDATTEGAHGKGATTMNPVGAMFSVAAEASLFEGLFRGVTLPPRALEELKRIGVDPKRLESKYRVDVWAHTIEIVRRHTYPDLPPDEANRRLGYDFSRGFESTIGGRMVLALLPLLKPATLLAKVPRFFKLGRPDITISWVSTSKTSGSLRVIDIAQVSPYFDAGLIQYMIERIGAQAKSRVEFHSLREFSIHYEWA